DCDRPFDTAQGYTDHLEELLAEDGLPAAVDPFGVCGETTFGGVTRIDSVLAQEPADAIILMEGTNDISSGNPIISLECIEDNFQIMADKAAAAGVEPVLASIIPYGPDVDGMDRNERAARLDTRLDDLASANGWAFADVFNFLDDIPNLFSTFYADGFHLNAAGNERLAEVFVDPVQDALASACVPGPCVPDDQTLCLGPDQRFAVRADWRLEDGREGVGTGTQLSSDTGRFWFFNPENIELVVKVLDGSCFNERIWVFYGALSNVEYSIDVTDTATCVERRYFNPAGNFASVGDTDAFTGDASGCPSP
ncbi:MAG: GDSL-type esterase/lipase family protein, partial [Acidobacteriota bacterium]